MDVVRYDSWLAAARCLLGPPSPGPQFLASETVVLVRPAFPKGFPNFVFQILRTLYEQCADDLLIGKLFPGYDEIAQRFRSGTSRIAWETTMEDDIVEAIALACSILVTRLASIQNTLTRAHRNNMEDPSAKCLHDFYYVWVCATINSLHSRFVPSGIVLGDFWILRESHLPKSPVQTTSERFRMIYGISCMFSRVLSALSYALEDDLGLHVEKLYELPERRETLKSIIAQAPQTGADLSNTYAMLASLDECDSTCSICLSSWQASTSEGLGGDDGKEPWLSLSADQRSLNVEAGYESVPLKMLCGHVFCAGCIKTWLADKNPLLACPFRDQEYGPFHSNGMHKINALGAEHGIALMKSAWG